MTSPIAQQYINLVTTSLADYSYNIVTVAKKSIIIEVAGTTLHVSSVTTQQELQQFAAKAVLPKLTPEQIKVEKAAKRRAELKKIREENPTIAQIAASCARRLKARKEGQWCASGVSYYYTLGDFRIRFSDHAQFCRKSNSDVNVVFNETYVNVGGVKVRTGSTLSEICTAVIAEIKNQLV